MHSVDVRFRHFRPSEMTRELIVRKAEKLLRHLPFTQLEVVVDMPHRRHRRGNELAVRIEGHLPGAGRLVAREKRTIDGVPALSDAVTSAFEAFELKAHKERRTVPPRGRHLAAL